MFFFRGGSELWSHKGKKISPIRLCLNWTSGECTELSVFNHQDNDTTYEEWVVYTGQKDVSTVNQIKSWSNGSSLSYWSNEYANMINGTGGYEQSFYIPPPIRHGVHLLQCASNIAAIFGVKWNAPLTLLPCWESSELRVYYCCHVWR